MSREAATDLHELRIPPRRENAHCHRTTNQSICRWEKANNPSYTTHSHSRPASVIRVIHSFISMLKHTRHRSEMPQHLHNKASPPQPPTQTIRPVKSRRPPRIRISSPAFFHHSPQVVCLGRISRLTNAALCPLGAFFAYLWIALLQPFTVSVVVTLEFGIVGV